MTRNHQHPGWGASAPPDTREGTARPPLAGADAALLVVGAGRDDALSGIQNITIITAAPFALVMVLLCVALARDLHDDPLMRRVRRSEQAVEQAVEYGTRNYGDGFFVPVKPHPPGDANGAERPRA